MKNSKSLEIIFALFLSILMISCSNDDEIANIQPSVSQIEMEAEGGEEEVTFTNGDWYIAEVRNHDNNVTIHGDRYSVEGEIIRENSPLILRSEGEITALWQNKGFIIQRNTPTSLIIHLNENSTGEQFGFNLVLKSGEEIKEIQVFQKESQGYHFNSMEFVLEEEDGDSLFVKKGTTVKFNTFQPSEMIASPYGGIDVHKHSIFTSSQNDAFVWIENDSIMVEVPSNIYSDEILFNGQQSLYGRYSTIKPHGFEETETIAIPAGESVFFFEQEWRKRQVSYILSLINNRTGKEKIIEGKWIETAPTGNYAIIWED